MSLEEYSQFAIRNSQFAYTPKSASACKLENIMSTKWLLDLKRGSRVIIKMVDDKRIVTEVDHVSSKVIKTVNGASFERLTGLRVIDESGGKPERDCLLYASVIEVGNITGEFPWDVER